MINMSYAMTLRDYMATNSPGAPLSSQTAYTSQFIRSLDEYEQVHLSEGKQFILIHVS